MTVRTDHVAGVFFIIVGLLVIALSGDLPIGSLSFPGAGFMPNILAVLTILFGAVLAIRASAESPALVTLDWSDVLHAVLVIVLTGTAIRLFEKLGFLITMVLLMVALLIVVERRRLVPTASYSLCVVVVTYLTFEYVLKTPLNTGPFGF